MQFCRVSACSAALLVVVVLCFAHAGSYGQPGQQHRPRRTQRGTRVSGSSCADQLRPRTSMEPAPERFAQPHSIRSGHPPTPQLAEARKAPGQHAMHVLVLPLRAASSPIVRDGRHQRRLTATDPAQAIKCSDQRISSSRSSSTSSSLISTRQAADEQPDSRQKASDSAGARARRGVAGVSGGVGTVAASAGWRGSREEGDRQRSRARRGCPAQHRGDLGRRRSKPSEAMPQRHVLVHSHSRAAVCKTVLQTVKSTCGDS